MQCTKLIVIVQNSYCKNSLEPAKNTRTNNKSGSALETSLSTVSNMADKIMNKIKSSGKINKPYINILSLMSEATIAQYEKRRKSKDIWT